jgi:branched-subunit amino acid ABC-type transport system permease component
MLLMVVLNDWQAHGKAMMASAVATFAMVGDIAAEAKGWEDVSLKVLLLIAVVFLVRLLLKQQAEYKAETVAREQRMLEALNRTAEGMEALTGLIQEQTDYFKSVVKHVVSERLQSQSPHVGAPPVTTKQP